VRALSIVLADPTRPAYEHAARAVITAHGWSLDLPATFDDDELIALAPAAEVLVTRRRPVPEAFFRAAQSLRAILHLGARPQQVAERFATEAGIPLETVPTRGTIAVAEHAMALLLALTRRIVPGHAGTVSGAYRERGLSPAPTSETQIAFQWLDIEGIDVLHGKTLGLLGFGEIGQAVARMARGFGMDVLYHRRRRLERDEEQHLGVEYADLESLVARAHVLSLHLPHTPETERLVDASLLARMPRGAYLVNVARGGVVDEDALVAALRSGHLAGAALDVFVEEPLAHDHPLVDLPNVVLSPHLGSAPARGLAEVMEALVPALTRLAATPHTARGAPT
jgi:phosphoglycerate dehydrogenase-like enzyme